MSTRSRVPVSEALNRLTRLTRKTFDPSDDSRWFCRGYQRATYLLPTIASVAEEFRAGLAVAAHEAVAQGIAEEVQRDGTAMEEWVALLNATSDYLEALGYERKGGQYVARAETGAAA